MIDLIFGCSLETKRRADELQYAMDHVQGFLASAPWFKGAVSRDGHIVIMAT